MKICICNINDVTRNCDGYMICIDNDDAETELQLVTLLNTPSFEFYIWRLSYILSYFIYIVTFVIVSRLSIYEYLYLC